MEVMRWLWEILTDSKQAVQWGGYPVQRSNWSASDCRRVNRQFQLFFEIEQTMAALLFSRPS